MLHDHLLHRLVLSLPPLRYARIIRRKFQIDHDEVRVLNAQLALPRKVDCELLLQQFDLHAEPFNRVDIIESIGHLGGLVNKKKASSSPTNEFQC